MSIGTVLTRPLQLELKLSKIVKNEIFGACNEITTTIIVVFASQALTNTFPISNIAQTIAIDFLFNKTLDAVLKTFPTVVVLLEYNTA